MELSELEQLLKMRGGFEVVDRVVGESRIRLLGRVPPASNSAWKIVISQIMLLSDKSSDWTADISIPHFWRGPKFVRAWRVILQGANIQEHLPRVADAVTGAPRPKAVIDEQPLVGVRADRNSPKGGKGAQGVLSAVVGPGAIAQMRRS